MQVSGIDFGIVVIYFLVILGIGMASMKKVENFDDYAVAGRSIPLALLFATLAATATGGGGTIGRVAYAYHTGLAIFAATLGFGINNIISGLFIAPKMREMGNVYTIGDMMGYYYGRAGRAWTGVFTFIYSVAIFGAQVLAMGKILHVMTGLPLVPLTVAASAITVLYTWAGGMYAVIYTDAIQFIILAFGLTTATVLAVLNLGGVGEIVATLSSTSPSHLKVIGALPTGKLLALFAAFLFGEFLAPFYVQRYLSSKSSENTKWGVTLFGIYYSFYTLIALAMGLAGFILLPNIDPDLVMSTIVRDYLPIGLVGLVFGGMIAAIMSTGDSILNTAAVIFTRDIYHKFINPNATTEKLLKYSKLATIVVGVGGVAAALSIPSVLTLLLMTYGLWAPSIIPPLVISIVWGKALERKVSPYAGVPAMVSGLTSAFVWGKVLGDPYGIPAIIVGLAVNITVFIVVHKMTITKVPKGSYIPEEIEQIKEAV